MIKFERFLRTKGIFAAHCKILGDKVLAGFLLREEGQIGAFTLEGESGKLYKVLIPDTKEDTDIELIYV
jgi:hypothetical protein